MHLSDVLTTNQPQLIIKCVDYVNNIMTAVSDESWQRVAADQGRRGRQREREKGSCGGDNSAIN